MTILLSSLLADSHDSCDSGQSIEIVPKPHPLNQQEDGTLASAVISEDGVFPSLDSTLLTQVSTCIVQYYYKLGCRVRRLIPNPYLGMRLQ